MFGVNLRRFVWCQEGEECLFCFVFVCFLALRRWSNVNLFNKLSMLNNAIWTIWCSQLQRKYLSYIGVKH